MKKFLIAAVVATASFVSAHAASISGLVNTGGSFASGAQDTNYSLNGSSFGYVTSNGTFPLAGNWMANTITSKWITPTTSQGESFDPSANGTYSWKLNFDLTGFNASTASFTGRFAADNNAKVKLNGTEVGSATDLPASTTSELLRVSTVALTRWNSW